MAPTRHTLQGLTLVAVSLPAIVTGVRAATSGLGANPIEALTHVTGEWALRWLLLALAITPARRWLGWAWAAPLRRTLGLAAFAYAALHLATWLVLDQFFDLDAIVEDVLERRYITAGFAAFACLVPLAVTSTRRWMRRLGRRWSALHRLAYVAAVMAVVHFLWLTKADLAPPLAHAALLAGLLAMRLRLPSSDRTRDRSSPVPPAP